jgi:hypothetical protein
MKVSDNAVSDNRGAATNSTSLKIFLFIPKYGSPKSISAINNYDRGSAKLHRPEHHSAKDALRTRVHCDR